MKINVLRALHFLASKSGLVSVFALFTLLFQVFLLTQARIFYPVLRAVFAVLFLQLVGAFIRAASRRKVLWLVLLLIILVRIPFYLHADGAMLTSDNACDGLQPVEMRAAHTAPFFLLGAVKHMGTVKYLIIAFFMDVLGNHYLVFLLVQALLFSVVLFTLYDLLKESLHPRAAFLLIFVTQFAFMETVFDYSLSLRGAPYLEMLFFVLLGAGLIEQGSRSFGRTIAGYYFLFFSIYIHPLGAVLVGSFGLVFLIRSFILKRFWANAGAAAAGLAAGLFHWFYYLLYLPKPVSNGGWEQMGILPFSHISFAYFREYFGVLRETFTGLFNFEFSYLSPVFDSGLWAKIGFYLNQALILASLAVTVAGVALAVWKIVRLIGKREPFRTQEWPWILEAVLAAAFAAKVFLFYPPHTEPRHNFDLVFLIMLSFLLVFSTLLRRRPRFGTRPAAAMAIGLAVLATLPHYDAFFKVVRDKEASYRKIMFVLEQGQVRNLTTDFIVAYSIYFLSGRTIRVSDSLGPFTVGAFYPSMNAAVDALPPGQKAYMFFSQRAPSRAWHKERTEIIFRKTLNELAAAPARRKGWRQRYPHLCHYRKVESHADLHPKSFAR